MVLSQEVVQAFKAFEPNYREEIIAPKECVICLCVMALYDIVPHHVRYLIITCDI